MIIAIDGPAGAGKSTVAMAIAERLGFRLISTGALYRAVALRAEEQGVSWDAPEPLSAIAAGLDVEFEVVDGVNRVRVDGSDVTEALRTPAISNGASIVSAHPAVRDALVALQRAYGQRFDVVMEGRDIGTVIFPDAELKVFLTASAAERARRRLRDYDAVGQEATFDAVLAEIEERDHRDSTRDVAPLVPAPDAELVDCTSMGVDEVVDGVVRLVEARRGA
jgi:cytidylate kinase